MLFAKPDLEATGNFRLTRWRGSLAASIGGFEPEGATAPYWSHNQRGHGGGGEGEWRGMRGTVAATGEVGGTTTLEVKIAGVYGPAIEKGLEFS